MTGDWVPTVTHWVFQELEPPRREEAVDRKEENLPIIHTEVEKARKQKKDEAESGGRQVKREEEEDGFPEQEVVISWGELGPAKGISQEPTENGTKIWS